MKKMLSYVVTIMIGLSVLSSAASFASNLLNPANMQSISDDVSVYFDDLISSSIHSISTGDFDVLSMIPQFNHKQNYNSKATVVTGFEVSSFDTSESGFGN